MCLFKALTGIPCPGCGMTRAFFHFFQGDFKTALFYHPLFWLVPFILIVAVVPFKPFRKWRNNPYLWGSCLGLFVGVYLWRMGNYFPHQAPLDFSSSGILPRVFNYFIG